MEAAGVTASPTTHAIMVKALIQAGDSEGAEAGLRQLVSIGEDLTASSFNSLITMHAKVRQRDNQLCGHPTSPVRARVASRGHRVAPRSNACAAKAPIALCWCPRCGHKVAKAQ